MRAVDLAWVAGLIEGEGSVYTKYVKGRPYPGIRVGMTDEDVVRRLHSLVPGSTITGPHEPTTAWGRKPWWLWYAQRQAVAAGLLMSIYPLMGQRRQQSIQSVLAKWRANSRPFRAERGQ